MIRFAFAAALAATAFAAVPATAETADDRLMIVNGNTGRVVYDDGRNDLFCVYRRVVVGHRWDGRPIVRPVMRCR